jgi:hypothetical protein
MTVGAHQEKIPGVVTGLSIDVVYLEMVLAVRANKPETAQLALAVVNLPEERTKPA